MTDTKVQTSTIEGILAFESLDSAQRAAVAHRLRLRLYPAGIKMIHPQNTGPEVYFIISGSIRICILSSCGKEVQFEDLSAGQMFGEIAAIDGGERTSDCIALSDTTIAIMSQSDFLNALDTYTGFNRYITKRLTKMLRRHMKRVIEFSTHTVRDRVRFEVLRIALSSDTQTPEGIIISQPPTHADIASRISTHREAVTRELKLLEKSGVVTWRPGIYQVHDIHALTTMT